MTELTIEIPTTVPLLDRVARAPEIARAAQETVIKRLGDDYVLALKRATPKGRGEERGNRLIDSYETDEQYGSTSSLYRIRNQAPQLAFVIKGRGPVVAQGARALRFVIDGQVIFRKRVGPAEANDYPSRVDAEMRPQVDAAGQQIADEIVRGLTG